METELQVLEQAITVLMPLLIVIESGSNVSAIGDNGRAVGILQIHPVVIADVNRILGKPKYTLSDRRNRAKSEEICRIYLLHHGRGVISREMSLTDRLVALGRIWNGGPEGNKKTSTLRYAEKIRKQIKETVFEPEAAALL